MATPNDAMKKAKLMALMKLMHPGNVGMPAGAPPRAPMPPPRAPRAQMMPPVVPPAASGSMPMPPPSAPAGVSPPGFALGGMFPKLQGSILPKDPSVGPMVSKGPQAGTNDTPVLPGSEPEMGATKAKFGPPGGGSKTGAPPLTSSKGIKESETKKNKPKM